MNSLVLKSLLAAALARRRGARWRQAQELKIGYVNSDRVLREADPAKAAQAKLEAEFSKREKDLNDLAQPPQGRERQARQGRAHAAEAERTRRQRELVDQDRDLQRKRREFQEDLSQRKNEELASVVERANRVIKQIFETEKYDLILQEAGVLEPEGRHHRQGDQGAQRPGRQVSGCGAGGRRPAARHRRSGSAAN